MFFFWVISILYADVSERSVRSVFIGRWMNTSYHLPMKMEQTECSEASAYKIQTPGNYPKENILYSEHGESLKSRSYDI